MHSRNVLLLILATGIAVAGVGLYATSLLSDDADESFAGLPTSVPFVPAPGAPTPGPSPTPIRFTGEPLLSEDQARHSFESAIVAYTDSAATVQVRSVALRQTGELGHQADLIDPAYPVWVIDATGSFHARSTPRGVPLPRFTGARVLIDGVTGRLLGVELTGQTGVQ